jgi:hypothetical protein
MAIDIGIPIWSFRANWKSPVLERLSFLTDLLRAEEGAEQRRSLRETPRRTVEADFLLRGPERTFFDLFVNRFAGGDVMIPLYWDIVSLPEATIIGTTDRINFNNVQREFVPGYAIIMGNDALTYEVVEIAGMDAEGIDLAAPTTRKWPRGATLMPLRRAFIDDLGTPSHVTAGIATATGRFLIREANPWWPEIIVPKHSPGWRYKLEPYETTDAEYAEDDYPYSDPDYDDSEWLIGAGPLHYHGPPHIFAFINDWGYENSTDIQTPQDIWMRRQLACAPGYRLYFNIAYDNLVKLWVDGVQVDLTTTGNVGLATGSIMPTRANPVVCLFVDETDGPAATNFTFADMEVSQRLPSVLPPPVYAGLPVFLEEPNWVEALDTAYDREVVRLDNNVGLPYQVDSLGRALLGQSHNWFLPGREKLAAFRDLLYRNRGRGRSFWLPTFKHDFRLVNSPLAGAAQIVVENTGFRYVGGPTSGREYIAIKHAGGTILRKILSVAAGTTSATEKLNLDAALGLDLSPGLVRRISFADVARFDSDDFEITHHMGLDGLAECSALFRTFKNTRSAPLPVHFPVETSLMTPFVCGNVGPQVVLPRHSPDWKYQLEPFDTTSSDYSATNYADSAWPLGHAPFYHPGGPHPWGGINVWGYTDGMDIGATANIWMRKRFVCSSGYTLEISAAFDNSVVVWIDGVVVPMTNTGQGTSKGTITAPRSNPVACVFINEADSDVNSPTNFTFGDIEIVQVPRIS